MALWCEGKRLITRRRSVEGSDSARKIGALRRAGAACACAGGYGRRRAMISVVQATKSKALF